MGEPLSFEQLALYPLWRKEAAPFQCITLDEAMAKGSFQVKEVDAGTVPLRRRYDVVLMNLPFGESAVNVQQYIKDNYPKTRQDLYSTFQAWREEILLKKARQVVVANLGYSVLDAMVETAAYCLEKVG